MADENKQNNEDQFRDNIEKHIDIAIEAQDGPVEKNSDASAIEEKKEDKPQQQSDTGKSGDGDGAAQQKPDKEGEKGKEPIAGARGQDLNTNEGVVKAGAERRFYDQRNLAREQLETERGTVTQLRNEIAQMTTKLETQQNAINEVHGVDPKTLALGVRIISDMQRDPTGTLKKLLAEAAAQGYTVDDIGSGVDMAAISRLIDERLPKQDNEQRSEEDIIREARDEANTFFNSFPDAKPHDKLIASVLRDHPELRLQDAYYQIKNAFIEKGFDWNLSLEDNLKTSGDLNTGGDNNQQTDQGGERKPLPIGGNGENVDIKSADVIALAGAEEDTGEIVRQAMRESGLKI